MSLVKLQGLVSLLRLAGPWHLTTMTAALTMALLAVSTLCCVHLNTWLGFPTVSAKEPGVADPATGTGPGPPWVLDECCRMARKTCNYIQSCTLLQASCKNSQWTTPGSASSWPSWLKAQLLLFNWVALSLLRDNMVTLSLCLSLRSMAGPCFSNAGSHSCSMFLLPANQLKQVSKQGVCSQGLSLAVLVVLKLCFLSVGLVRRVQLDRLLWPPRPWFFHGFEVLCCYFLWY